MLADGGSFQRKNHRARGTGALVRRRMVVGDMGRARTVGFGGWCVGTFNWTSRAASTWTVRHVADVELIDDAGGCLMMTSRLRLCMIHTRIN